MEETTQGTRAELYIQGFVENLGNLEEFSSYFDKATEQEWQDCLLCFDDINATISQLEKHMFKFLKKEATSK